MFRIDFSDCIEFPDPGTVLVLLGLFDTERSAKVCARRQSEKYFEDRIQWVYTTKKKEYIFSTCVQLISAFTQGKVS